MTPALPALEATIASALEYVLSMQAEDGSWTEWALPPGSSSTWTTAYVGFRLRDLQHASLTAPRLLVAARWLVDQVSADYGWGYNKLVGSDADSTSYTILFLASSGENVPEASFRMLHTLQRPDGGFGTYLPIGTPNSWNVSHPDVTPIALLALLRHPEPDRYAIQQGMQYVRKQMTSLGLWNSFWWSSCLYGTEASLSFLDAAEIEMPSPQVFMQIQPTNAFESGLLISSLLYLGFDSSHSFVRDLVDQLIGQQRPNGSWDTAPVLRITRRDCYEPWACANPGQLYAETSRLFTTVTALHALAKVHGMERSKESPESNSGRSTD